MLHAQTRYKYELVGPEGENFRIVSLTNLPVYDQVIGDEQVQNALAAACQKHGVAITSFCKLEEIPIELAHTAKFNTSALRNITPEALNNATSEQATKRLPPPRATARQRQEGFISNHFAKLVAAAVSIFSIGYTFADLLT